MPARTAAKSKKRAPARMRAKVAPARAAIKAKPAKAAPAKTTVVKAKAARAPKAAPKAAVKLAPVAPVKKASVAKAQAKPIKPAKPVVISPEWVKFRELLLSEKARLEIELEEIESRTARTTDAERATELSSYEDHPADLASETFEREKDLAIAESVESLYNQVNTALEKIERGTYGTCDACGRPIKKARLQALPFATLCLDCQDRLEG